MSKQVFDFERLTTHVMSMAAESAEKAARALDAVAGTSSGHGGPGAVLGTSSGHGGLGAVLGTSSGHGGPGAVLGTSSGHGGPGAVLSTSSGHGGPGAVLSTSSGHGGPAAVLGTSAGHFIAESQAAINQGFSAAVELASAIVSSGCVRFVEDLQSSLGELSSAVRTTAMAVDKHKRPS